MHKKYIYTCAKYQCKIQFFLWVTVEKKKPYNVLEMTDWISHFFFQMPFLLNRLDNVHEKTF